jgi:NADH:ubiquinone oxidoreductase subunit K
VISLVHYLVLGAILFAISVAGIFLNRKNVIVLLMAIELMLLAVNINFIAFSHYLGDYAGQVFVFFILTVAAAESAIGLAILVVLFRNRQTINVEDLDASEGLSGCHGWRRSISPSSLRRCSAPSSPACSAGRSAAPARTRSPSSACGLRSSLSAGASRTCCAGAATFNGTSTPGRSSGGCAGGRLPDRPLTAMMMVVVTFVSLMVHVYTIGYMHDDPGYQRFFSYISLFTFSMLMLVMSNNFLQLFFGWEAVGLVSYLLIGFWYKRPTAIFANLKAFLVNRVGDFGFLLGIAWCCLLRHAGLRRGVRRGARRWPRPISSSRAPNGQLLTVICICLFIGAMGKSAQVPAARVAARLDGRPDADLGADPRRDHGHRRHLHGGAHVAAVRAVDVRCFVLVIGAITALFMGLLGIVQNDIKRVVAYSTLSQLGYMTVALGASAYAAAVFHLMTHAFFKALLFLAAGSVIIAMHHEQDIRRWAACASTCRSPTGPR